MGTLPYKRIRLGVTGLAMVFLLVLLGTAVTGTREEVPVDPTLGNELAEEAPPSEPLSDIGAVPGQTAEPDVPIEPIPIPIDPTTEELIVNEIPPAPAPQ